MKCHFLLLLPLLFLPSCQKKSLDFDKVQQVTILEKYTISLPRAMEKTDTLGKSAPYQYKFSHGPLYFLAIDDPVEDLKKVMPQVNLDFYLMLTRQQLEKSLEGLSSLKPKPLTLAGQPALNASFSGLTKKSTLKVYYQVAVIDLKDRYLKILLWTSGDGERTWGKHMDKIIHSFQLAK